MTAGQLPGRVDQPHHAEGLRRVAELAAESGVVLLGQQPDVVAQGEQPLEHRLRALGLPRPRERVGVPEAARQERPLRAGEAVDPAVGLRVVAHDEAAVEQCPLDGGDRPPDALVGPREEPHAREQQQGRVQPLRPVELGERAALRIEPVAADLRVHAVAQPPPLIDRSVEAVFLDGVHGPVHTGPGHHLGVHEVSARPAHLPQPVVRFGPVPLEEVQQGPLHVPGRVAGLHARFPGQVQTVEHLAPHVELQLVGGGVPDPDGAAVPIPGQPRYLGLGDAPPTVEPVHDLQLVGVAGDRADQPLAPGARLLHVSRPQQRLQGERRVAQPTEAVVPVAGAAEFLRE